MGNLQGNITEIIEPDFGFVCAEYYYDAYGNYVVKDPASSWYSGDIHAKYVDAAVPFTYRGYLDINIGDYHLYYLGSRFYSPQLGRFLNADIHVDTGTGFLATNMFAYCNNNPVMFVDPTGEMLKAIMKLLNAFLTIIKQLKIFDFSNEKEIDYQELYMFAAVVYAESGGESDLCIRAVAHCIMNRVASDSWENQTTVTAVITAPGQFEGYNSIMYKAAMDYYNYNVYASTIDKRAMDNTFNITKKVYTGKDANISNGATFFFSPSYDGDEWYYANSFERVYIDGISSDVFMFYK